ncbi:MAG: hypothetical protein ACOYXB_01710 [Bacteroidota bacterium]
MIFYSKPIRRPSIQVFRLVLVFLTLAGAVSAQTPWPLNFTVAPAWFGPNALPVPTLQNGLLEDYPNLELGTDAYLSPGDQTRDLMSNLFIPVTRKRIGLNVYYIPFEHFRVDSMTNVLRNSMISEGTGTAAGDFHIGTFIQLIRDHHFLPDLLVTINLKTASGTNLLAARYTDSPGYYFDISAGKTLIKGIWELRLYAMTGFYCYQTNLANYPQNDAVMYGAGFTAGRNKYALSAQLTGYSGYLNNGDHPMVSRIILERKGEKGPGFRLQWQAGLRDFAYQSFRFSVIWRIRKTGISQRWISPENTFSALPVSQISE